MASAANRGKYAESQVKALLKKLESANCTHHRFPDAHSGSFVTAPADFMLLQDGKLRLLEVKQVEHQSRLPYGNFKADQLARMLMWQAAGAGCWVLVCHMPDKFWRLLPAEYFKNRQLVSETGKPVGSWNLKDVPTQTLTGAFGLIRDAER